MNDTLRRLVRFVLVVFLVTLLPPVQPVASVAEAAQDAIRSMLPPPSTETLEQRWRDSAYFYYLWNERNRLSYCHGNSSRRYCFSSCWYNYN